MELIVILFMSYILFRKESKKALEMWHFGLSPSVRGQVWKLAVGNDLYITKGINLCISQV